MHFIISSCSIVLIDATLHQLQQLVYGSWVSIEGVMAGRGTAECWTAAHSGPGLPGRLHCSAGACARYLT